MRKWKRIYKIIFIILILIFLVFERFYLFIPKINPTYSKDIDRTNLNQVISDYIINNYGISKDQVNYKRFESHKVYKIKPRYGLQYVYIYTLYGIYEVENGKYQLGSGGANPLVIIVNKDNNDRYSVLGYKDFNDIDDNNINLPPTERKIFNEIDTDKLLKELNNDIYFQMQGKLGIKEDIKH
ncbi:hypothetical protein NRP93_003473 [Clostridium botulinum]|nr:hypothetical protein [Clostridium botulinum]